MASGCDRPRQRGQGRDGEESVNLNQKEDCWGGGGGGVMLGRGGETGEGRASRSGFSKAPAEVCDSLPWMPGKTHCGRSCLLLESSMGKAVL